MDDNCNILSSRADKMLLKATIGLFAVFTLCPTQGLEPCPGDTRGDKRCNHDSTHRVCAKVSLTYFIGNSSLLSDSISSTVQTSTSLIENYVLYMHRLGLKTPVSGNSLARRPGA